MCDQQGQLTWLLQIFMWGSVNHYAYLVHIQSLPPMEERIEQAMAAVSTKTFGKILKNINSRFKHIRRVKGRHIEEDNICIEFIEYIC